MARYVDGDKEQFWRVACKIMIDGSWSANFEAACALESIDESMPEWVMSAVWDYAVVCGLGGDKRKGAVAGVALDGVAKSAVGRRFLLGRLRDAGERGRLAMRALGLDDPELAWRH